MSDILKFYLSKKSEKVRFWRVGFGSFQRMNQSLAATRFCRFLGRIFLLGDVEDLFQMRLLLAGRRGRLFGFVFFSSAV
jgi:hypothetical protein